MITYFLKICSYKKKLLKIHSFEFFYNEYFFIFDSTT